MKILHVIPSVGPLRGGPSTVVQVLAQGLAAQGFEVDVAATDDNGPGRLAVPVTGQPVVQNGVRYFYFPRQFRFYTVSLPFAGWLERNVANYDLVHVHALFSYMPNMAAAAAKRHGVPYIIRPLGVLNRWGVENRRPLLKKLSFRYIEKPLLDRAAFMHYTSEQEEVEARELGVSTDGIIVGNPVDVPPPESVERGYLRERFPELRDKLVYLYLSRIDYKKGVELLLDAFARLSAKRTDAALAIVGDGPPELVARLKQQARDLKLDGKVVWAGFFDAAGRWKALRDADVFVLSSFSENFGVVVVEAMGMELPVVITDQVGIYPLIQRTASGIVTACHVDPLVEALDRLGNDADLRHNMGRAGRETAVSEFSLTGISRKLAAIYQQVGRQLVSTNS